MRTVIALTLALAFSGSAEAQDASRSWHLLTITEGGTVTLLKDITKHECEFARARAKGEPATPEEKEAERARERAISERDGAMCPPDSATKEDWKKWQAEHRGAQGCAFSNNGYMSWAPGRLIGPGTIKSAECFP